MVNKTWLLLSEWWMFIFFQISPRLFTFIRGKNRTVHVHTKHRISAYSTDAMWVQTAWPSLTNGRAGPWGCTGIQFYFLGLDNQSVRTRLTLGRNICIEILVQQRHSKRFFETLILNMTFKLVLKKGWGRFFFFLQLNFISTTGAFFIRFVLCVFHDNSHILCFVKF